MARISELSVIMCIQLIQRLNATEPVVDRLVHERRPGTVKTVADMRHIFHRTKPACRINISDRPADSHYRARMM